MKEDAEIIELERRVDEARRILWERKDALHQAMVARCKVNVGQIVRSRGKEYRVAEISNPEYGWIVGNPRKADGTWGIAKRNLFSNYEIEARTECDTPTPTNAASDTPQPKA